MEKKEFHWDYEPVRFGKKLAELEEEISKSKILISHNKDRKVSRTPIYSWGGWVHHYETHDIISSESKKFLWSVDPLVSVEFWFPKEIASVWDFYRGPQVSVEYLSDSLPQDLSTRILEAMSQDFLDSLAYYKKNKDSEIRRLGSYNPHFGVDKSEGYEKLVENIKKIIYKSIIYKLDNKIIDEARSLLGLSEEDLQKLIAEFE